MSEKRPVEAQVVEADVLGEILELYKRKKTPDGRRDCIKAMAKAHGLKEREIAEFLLDQGCQVDGRLVRRKNTRTVSAPMGPEMPGWDGPEEVVSEPEPEPEAVSEPAPRVLPMTAGVLREILAKAAPGAEVYIEGAPLRGLRVTVCFGADGDLTDAAVFLDRA